MGQVVAGRYRLVDVLGEGGMGVVYGGVELSSGRAVAVKVPHPGKPPSVERDARMWNEVLVASALQHQAICPMVGWGRLPDGQPFLVLERLDGRTLGAVLREQGRVDWPVAALWIAEVLDGLQAAHSQGVVHRDLKPENVFVLAEAEREARREAEREAQREARREAEAQREARREARREAGQGRPGLLGLGTHSGSRVRLLDFGAATGRDSAVPRAVEVGSVVGSPAYMAPEQARGQGLFDFRVDLWAAGVILYEAVTGRRPFLASNYNALLVQILQGKRAPLVVAWSAGEGRGGQGRVGGTAAQVPPGLAALEPLVERLLAPEPSKRGACASDVAGELRQLVSRLALAPMEPNGEGEASDLGFGTVVMRRVGSNRPIATPRMETVGSGRSSSAVRAEGGFEGRLEPLLDSASDVGTDPDPTVMGVSDGFLADVERHRRERQSDGGRSAVPVGPATAGAPGLGERPGAEGRATEVGVTEGSADEEEPTLVWRVGTASRRGEGGDPGGRQG